MKKPLTKKQQSVYELIQQYAAKNDGNTPTLHWLQNAMTTRSISAVVKHLDALERKGYICRRKHAKKNNIALLDESGATPEEELVQVPVLASVGCDDLSVEANESWDETLPVSRAVVDANGGIKNVVSVRAVGDSMNDADIENGDYVLVQLTDEPKTGDKVVAVVNNMVTLKKMEKRENTVVLWPVSQNKYYKPIVVNKDFKVAGKVIDTIEQPRDEEIRIIPNE